MSQDPLDKLIESQNLDADDAWIIAAAIFMLLITYVVYLVME